MNLTCICCPMGCALQAEVENGAVISVSGNTCQRGADYAKAEAVAPVRTVTGTVRASGGVRPVVAVKTVPEVPKSAIPLVMAEIRRFRGTVPIHTGDVLIENIAATGSRLIATADLPVK